MHGHGAQCGQGMTVAGAAAWPCALLCGRLVVQRTVAGSDPCVSPCCRPTTPRDRRRPDEPVSRASASVVGATPTCHSRWRQGRRMDGRFQPSRRHDDEACDGGTVAAAASAATQGQPRRVLLPVLGVSAVTFVQRGFSFVTVAPHDDKVNRPFRHPTTVPGSDRTHVVAALWFQRSHAFPVMPPPPACRRQSWIPTDRWPMPRRVRGALAASRARSIVAAASGWFLATVARAMLSESSAVGRLASASAGPKSGSRWRAPGWVEVDAPVASPKLPSAKGRLPPVSVWLRRRRLDEIWQRGTRRPGDRSTVASATARRFVGLGRVVRFERTRRRHAREDEISPPASRADGGGCRAQYSVSQYLQHTNTPYLHTPTRSAYSTVPYSVHLLTAHQHAARLQHTKTRTPTRSTLAAHQHASLRNAGPRTRLSSRRAREPASAGRKVPACLPAGGEGGSPMRRRISWPAWPCASASCVPPADEPDGPEPAYRPAPAPSLDPPAPAPPVEVEHLDSGHLYCTRLPCAVLAGAGGAWDLTLTNHEPTPPVSCATWPASTMHAGVRSPSTRHKGKQALASHAARRKCAAFMQRITPTSTCTVRSKYLLACIADPLRRPHPRRSQHRLARAPPTHGHRTTRAQALTRPAPYLLAPWHLGPSARQMARYRILGVRTVPSSPASPPRAAAQRPDINPARSGAVRRMCLRCVWGRAHQPIPRAPRGQHSSPPARRKCICIPPA
ncbi:hypothetical protein DCS_03196 [Drechmeria coniospora]|uniref:Uncharacterized protein n=1 Tax=Drechmeria coniospora TaxID=98403 RepID=A0A151GY86_DRECN|nr:hypothetical protein DCS_03196 [Drechmeria coniospora]KYK62051.1 hypothetical protein DCS_03196 [Drechmeria coniospora]